MSPSLLTNTPLAELADTRGWFAVSTPLAAGGTLRSVVYVDGDVTTKLIGARTLSADDTATHFAAIDQQADLVRARLRGFVLALTALWIALAAGLVVVLRDPASVLGALALLVPLGILLVQRALRRTLTVSAPTIAAIGAALTIVAALTFGLDGLLIPASVTLALNLALVVGFAVVRSKLRAILHASNDPKE